MPAGAYELAKPFELFAGDSGTQESPIVYRATQGAEVRLVGGRQVNHWQPVTDPAILARLDPAACGHVLQADLMGQGITDLGQLKAGPTWAQSEPGLELFFNDQPMTPARWPNEGFTKIPAVLGGTPVDVRGTKGCKEGVFSYEGDRPSRWSAEPEIMLHGYWFWDWADQRLKVASIDTRKRVITLEPKPQHSYGFRKGQWYYAYNLLCELDRPGEWYLDRQAGRLYFWPPGPIDQGRPTVSLLPAVVKLKDVSYVTLRGLTLECVRGTAVTISGGKRSRLGRLRDPQHGRLGGLDQRRRQRSRRLRYFANSRRRREARGGRSPHAPACPAVRRELPHPPVRPLESGLQTGGDAGRGGQSHRP